MRQRVALTLLVLMLILVACASPNISAPVSENIEPTPDANVNDETLESILDASVSLNESLEPTPTLRVVMQATDPSTVVKAAGRPQFIEYFAYW